MEPVQGVIEPGQCVIESGQGVMKPGQYVMEPGQGVIEPKLVGSRKFTLPLLLAMLDSFLTKFLRVNFCV